MGSSFIYTSLPFLLRRHSVGYNRKYYGTDLLERWGSLKEKSVNNLYIFLVLLTYCGVRRFRLFKADGDFLLLLLLFFHIASECIVRNKNCSSSRTFEFKKLVLSMQGMRLSSY